MENMEKMLDIQLSEMITDTVKNVLKLKINTTWLITQRKSVATKQEAAQLGMQIRSNRNNLAEFEEFLAFLKGFEDRDFSLLQEEIDKEMRTKKEKNESQAAQ